MDAVLLACLSALLFGALAVSIRLALARRPDPELGALVSVLVALLVVGVGLALTGDWHDARGAGPFLLTGVLSPGLAQILFFRAVANVGAARTAVLVGTAPVFSVGIALVALGEPARLALLIGALLVVLGGVALAGERVRPDDFRGIGVLLALSGAILFATRDNLLRWLAGDTEVRPLLAAAATLLGGTVVIVAYLALRRGRRLGAGFIPVAALYAPAGLLFGLSYISLFEAYYRGRVTVVSPLVATESLWGVVFSAAVFRRSEVIGGPLVAGALLVVAGGALIGAFR